MLGARTKEASLTVPGLGEKGYIMDSSSTSPLKCPAIPNPESREKNMISQRDCFERKVLQRVVPPKKVYQKEALFS